MSTNFLGNLGPDYKAKPGRPVRKIGFGNRELRHLQLIAPPKKKTDFRTTFRGMVGYLGFIAAVASVLAGALIHGLDLPIAY